MIKRLVVYSHCLRFCCLPFNNYWTVWMSFFKKLSETGNNVYFICECCDSVSLSVGCLFYILIGHCVNKLLKLGNLIGGSGLQAELWWNWNKSFRNRFGRVPPGNVSMGEVFHHDTWRGDALIQAPWASTKMEMFWQSLEPCFQSCASLLLSATKAHCILFARSLAHSLSHSRSLSLSLALCYTHLLCLMRSRSRSLALSLSPSRSLSLLTSSLSSSPPHSLALPRSLAPPHYFAPSHSIALSLSPPLSLPPSLPPCVFPPPCPLSHSSPLEPQASLPDNWIEILPRRRPWGSPA